MCVYTKKNRGQLPLFFVEEMSNKFFVQTLSKKTFKGSCFYALSSAFYTDVISLGTTTANSSKWILIQNQFYESFFCNYYCRKK